MKRVLCLLLCLLLSGAVLAQEAEAEKEEQELTRSPEALEILKKVDTAIKAVNSVRCEASSTPSGVATNFVSAAEGSSVMVGWAGNGPEKFYAHVKTTNREGEPVEVSGGGNGDMYFLIDHSAKKAYEDMDPGVMGSTGRSLQAAGMLEFVHNAPFDDELNAESVELEGEETVAGEPCHKIHVKYAGGAGESIWFFSKNDFLPRRRVQMFNIPDQGDGTLEITITKLEVNIEPEDDMFLLKLPEGYEQIDDFAP
jgi:outer membrane lipoprotein-sorting protein